MQPSFEGVNIRELAFLSLGICHDFFSGSQCLRYCAINRKVVGSIPAGVIGNFLLT